MKLSEIREGKLLVFNDGSSQIETIPDYSMLLEQKAYLLSLLDRAREWLYQHEFDDELQCPDCWETSQEHESDCKLAALLKELSE